MSKENLRFLVDESSGKKLATFLLEKGFDVKFAGDEIAATPDSYVLAAAKREKRILVTNDKDFGELVIRLKKPASGVILLRLKLDSIQNRQKCTLSVIETLQDKLITSFVVVTEGLVRVRKISA